MIGTSPEQAWQVLLLACQAVPSSRAIGLMLIALSAVCFAAMPVFARAVYAAGGDPGTLLTLRFCGAAVVLLLLAFGRRAAIPTGRSLVGLLLMGGVGYVSQSLSYFTALTMTSAALLGYSYICTRPRWRSWPDSSLAWRSHARGYCR